AARNAANEAASDAAIAGKAAAAAQSEADAANAAASRAESDASAARGAAASAERDAAAAEASAASAQKHADSAAIAADQALGYAVEAQKAFERAEAADRERERQERVEDIEGGGDLTPDEEKDLLASMTPEERARYQAAKAQADQGILDFIKANAGDLVLSLLGLDNIKGCFMDGNISACLWALADFIPWSKALSLTADLVKFAPKIARFVNALSGARKEVDELTDLAKARKKADEIPCTGLAAARSGLRAQASAKSAAAGEACPINATKTLASRSAAFRDAKRDLKIPMNKVPDKVERVPMTDKFGNPVLDANKQRIMTREYHFTRDDGSKVVIQDHSAGHQFGEGGVGDQGRHLNVRPGDNTRTGKVEGTAQHYEW
ncbi:HNH/endonuclease VII fold putative polymorphic toxin, partial [Paractinoplanes abujensis]